MNIKKVRFNDTAIKKIYFDSFPRKERMPFTLMILMSKLWHTKFLSFYDENSKEPCGFIYLAKNRKIVFIMFFAVESSLRSCGYGSQMLNQIKKMFPNKKIIVSTEPCNTESVEYKTQLKRKEFYLNNDFIVTGYAMTLLGIKQEILITNGDFNKLQFLLFFVFYSNGSIWPRIRRSTI